MPKRLRGGLLTAFCADDDFPGPAFMKRKIAAIFAADIAGYSIAIGPFAVGPN